MTAERAHLDASDHRAQAESWLATSNASGSGRPQPFPIDLRLIWSQMLGGRLTVVAYWSAEGTCFVEFAQPDAETTRRIPERDLGVLHRTLLGTSAKQVGFELEKSPPTVSISLARSLRRLGVGGTPRRLPLFLVMVAHAATTRIASESLEARLVAGPGERRLLLMREPDLRSSSRLTAAEREVVVGLINGESHSAIARHRQRSQRTVANQLASAFAKLRVSGRLELLCRLVLSSFGEATTDGRTQTQLHTA